MFLRLFSKSPLNVKIWQEKNKNQKSFFYRCLTLNLVIVGDLLSAKPPSFMILLAKSSYNVSSTFNFLFLSSFLPTITVYDNWFLLPGCTK